MTVLKGRSIVKVENHHSRAVHNRADGFLLLSVSHFLVSLPPSFLSFLPFLLVVCVCHVRACACVCVWIRGAWIAQHKSAGERTPHLRGQSLLPTLFKAASLPHHFFSLAPG